jgi:hypothetical protein
MRGCIIRHFPRKVSLETGLARVALKPPLQGEKGAKLSSATPYNHRTFY